MRSRFRNLGFSIGRVPTGQDNAITDVPGVRVGHTTLIKGEGQLKEGEGPVRTGVTAIVPPDPIFNQRVLAGAFVLNGAGEMSGLTQLDEWGLLETPILLTSTMSVGKVSDAAVKWMTRHFPGIGTEYDAIIPIVGECDDSWLNDAVGRHVRSEHVYRAIEQAHQGPVEEGSVGAGTGLVTCDFKAGIGTSSRRISMREYGAAGVTYNLGVLVQSNFGVMHSLRVAGVPVGEILAPEFEGHDKRVRNGGSIITILATDAPLLPSQISRLCKRAALGIGRMGSYAAHTSGEILIGFSTANQVPRKSHSLTHRIEVLGGDACDGLYEAVVECTEEAIINALCTAEPMRGQNDHFVPALPLDRLTEILQRHHVAMTTQPTTTSH